MGYRILADGVVVLHGLFIVFVVLGGLLALRWRRVALVHLPCAIWGGIVEFMGWVCPLTPLENRLRRAAGESGYDGGFVEQYLIPLMYPGDLDREMQVVLGLLVVFVNALVYGVVLFRGRASNSG